MPIENDTVCWRQILKVFVACTSLSSIKKNQEKFWNKNSDKNISRNFDCRTESTEIGICHHGIFSSDSIENKVITTMKGGFYFIIGCNRQVK